MLSTQKRIIFRIVPGAVLAILLVLVEIALRSFVPSLSSPFLREISVDSTLWYQINRGYLEKYFPASAAMVPELKPSIIRKEKTKNTFRIFCVGESSMFGTPYELSATIPALIRKQLRHMIPDREIEVVNFGASAINSNVILDLAPHLAALRPDVVLIYTGHNEFYGPDGVGASWIEKRLPFLTKLKYRTRDLRLIRLAQRTLGAIGGGASAGEKNLMKEVSRGAMVELDSPEAKRVFGQFAQNLREILRTFRSAGIAVIASDVSSNLMFPPFAHPEHLAADEIPREYAAGKFQDLLQRLNAARTEDSSDAYVDYWLGRTHLALGEPHEAVPFLRRAKDEDLLKFRAPEEINAIIRSVCRDESTACLSADSLLCSHSPRGITDQTLFWEHLHPNVRGYDLIARLFVEEVRSLGLLPVSGSHDFPDLLPFNADSLSLCWLDLAYAEISVKGLTGRWPFTDFHAPSPALDSADAVQRRLVLDVYDKKIGWPQACLQSAEHAEHTGHVQEAMRTYGAMIEEYPFEYYPHYRLALLYKTGGESRSSEAEYRRCLELNPNYFYALIDLGLLQNNDGDFEEARRNLTSARTLTQGKDLPLVRAQIFYGLAAVSANTGDIAQAQLWITASLRAAPSYSPAIQLQRQILSSR